LIRKLKKLKKLRKARQAKRLRPGRKKTGITWAAIKKANKARKSSKLERKFYKLLDDAGITYTKEKAVGRCHADIFICPDLLVECAGCWWHSCKECFPNPTASQKKAIIKDIKRFQFFRSKGFRVIEIWEHEVNRDPLGSLQKVIDLITKHE
jgi:G:T-mismatch repair DNA endonuclease (very short patch repair protein)